MPCCSQGRQHPLLSSTKLVTTIIEAYKRGQACFPVCDSMLTTPNSPHISYDFHGLPLIALVLLAHSASSQSAHTSDDGIKMQHWLRLCVLPCYVYFFMQVNMRNYASIRLDFIYFKSI